MYSTQQAGEETWEALKAQVMRLGQLDGYPSPDFKAEAFRELVIALQNADTLKDAAQFIDDVMMYEMVCPKPTQLRDIIRAAKEAVTGSPALKDIDAWKAMEQFPADATVSERENLAAHLRILEARMAETRSQQPTVLKEALEIAGRQLLRGERVTGTY